MNDTSTPSHRPGLLLPGLMMLAGVAGVLTLGVWQIQRGGEKGFFLDKLRIQAASAPAAMPAVASWATLDPAAIAAALGLGPVAPFYLEAERQGDALTPPAGVDAKELIARIPDNHLSYALTWFGLAATLIGVFAAFAWQGRRKFHEATG